MKALTKLIHLLGRSTTSPKLAVMKMTIAVAGAILMAAASGVLVSGSANAAFMLDFNGLDGADLESVGNYYAGGYGSLGSGPGPNYGITFPAPEAVVCL